MARYIDADALEKEMLFWSDAYGYGGLTKDNIREIIKSSPTADVVDKERYDRLLENGLIISEALNKYQTADVRENVHARWLWVDGVRCSNCNHKLQTTGLPSFCQNCGAQMYSE